MKTSLAVSGGPLISYFMLLFFAAVVRQKKMMWMWGSNIRRCKVILISSTIMLYYYNPGHFSDLNLPNLQHNIPILIVFIVSRTQSTIHQKFTINLKEVKTSPSQSSHSFHFSPTLKTNLLICDPDQDNAYIVHSKCGWTINVSLSQGIPMTSKKRKEECLVLAAIVGN